MLDPPFAEFYFEVFVGLISHSITASDAINAISINVLRIDLCFQHLLTLDPEKIEWDGLTEEQRTRMRELYLEQERDLLDELRTLQHGFAIYPLGKDRLENLFF